MLSVGELLWLWHGDDNALGCVNAKIAAAVCEQTQPKDLAELKLLFYPALDDKDVPAAALEELRHGFGLWDGAKALA